MQLLNGSTNIIKNNNTSVIIAAPDSMSTLKTIAQEVLNRTGHENTSPPVESDSRLIQQQQQQREQQQTFNVDSTSNGSNNTNINNSANIIHHQKTSGTNEALIPPLLGVAPLGPSPLQKDHQLQV